MQIGTLGSTHGVMLSRMPSTKNSDSTPGNERDCNVVSMRPCPASADEAGAIDALWLPRIPESSSATFSSSRTERRSGG